MVSGQHDSVTTGEVHVVLLIPDDVAGDGPEAGWSVQALGLFDPDVRAA